MSNQFTIQRWGCLYPGCPVLLDEIKVPLNKKYCQFHKQLRKKENWTRGNRVRSSGESRPKINPLIHLLKTNKVVSIYQIMGFCNIKNRRTIHIHMVALRRTGMKIYYGSGMYHYEGMKK